METKGTVKPFYYDIRYNDILLPTMRLLESTEMVSCGLHFRYDDDLTRIMGLSEISHFVIGAAGPRISLSQ